MLVPDGGERALARCELRVGAHPIPDERGAAATREILAFAARPGPDDVLLVLLSGGGSSLLCAPAPGLALADVAATVRALLAAGASIDELNTVRKHLAAATGGRLARASRAGRIEVLAISDVVGRPPRRDRVGTVRAGSEPLRRRARRARAPRSAGGACPRAVRAHLEAGARGEREETPKPGDPAFARTRHTLIASNATALDAAREAAAARGWRAVAAHGRAVRARRASRRSAWSRSRDAAPRRSAAVPGRGRRDGRDGARRAGAAGAARSSRSRPRSRSRGAATSRCSRPAPTARDGPTDAAGAFADGDTVARGRRAGVDAAAALADNDSHGFFCREGGVIRTGIDGHERRGSRARAARCRTGVSDLRDAQSGADTSSSRSRCARACCSA